MSEEQQLKLIEQALTYVDKNLNISIEYILKHLSVKFNGENEIKILRAGLLLGYIDGVKSKENHE